jgi:hypothetical protein
MLWYEVSRVSLYASVGRGEIMNCMSTVPTFGVVQPGNNDS